MIIVAWILGICTVLGGLAAIVFFWDKILAWFGREPEPIPEMQISRKAAYEMGLEAHLKAQGYRLFWGDVREREYYLRFGDYELIEWTDDQGKTWVLGPAPGEDLPLKTRFQSQEIEKRREERKRRAQEGSNH